MKRTRTLNQWILVAVLALISILCVLPIWLLFAASFTSEQTIATSGYSFFPNPISFDAYQYIAENASQIFRAYGISVLVTVIGTALGLTLTTMLAYALSRVEMPFARGWTFYVLFTMLFSGGLVPTYLLYTDVFHMKNTIWALIFPMLLMKGFFIFVMRTFYRTSIPKVLIESAYLDGASEWQILRRIILPLSTPILATIGLFYVILYWNDWFNGLIFLTNSDYYSMQNLLNRMLLDAQFLAQSTDSGGGSNAAQLPLLSLRMAMGAAGILPILIAYPFFQKYFVKGLTVGAVKG